MKKKTKNFWRKTKRGTEKKAALLMVNNNSRGNLPLSNILIFILSITSV